MTFQETAEEILYKKYEEIKKSTKKKIRVKLQKTIESKFREKAVLRDEYFDEESFWTPSKLAKLEEKAKEKFIEKLRNSNLKEQMFDKAIAEYCEEINQGLEFYKISIQKEKVNTNNKKAVYRNNSELLQAKYGYKFIITGSPRFEKFENISDEQKLVDEYEKEIEKLVKQADHITEEELVKKNTWIAESRNLFKCAKILRKLNIKQATEARFPLYKKQYPNITENDVKKAIKNRHYDFKGTSVEVRDGDLLIDSNNLIWGANEIYNRQNPNIRNEPVVQGLSKKSIDSILGIRGATGDIVIKSFCDDYFQAKNEVDSDSDDYSIDNGDLEFLGIYPDKNLIWDEDLIVETKKKIVKLKNGFEEVLVNKVITAHDKSEKIYAAYLKKKSRDIQFLRKHYQEDGRFIYDGVLVDVNIISTSETRDIATEQYERNNRPSTGDDSTMFNNNKITPYIRPDLPNVTITPDGLVLTDFFKHNVKQNKKTGEYSVKNTHRTLIDTEFGASKRREADEWEMLDKLQAEFGDKWKEAIKSSLFRSTGFNDGNYLTVEDIKNKHKAVDKDFVAPYPIDYDKDPNHRYDIKEPERQTDFTSYKTQMKRFTEGSCVYLANKAQHEAKLMFDKASRGLNKPNYTYPKMKLDNVKLQKKVDGTIIHSLNEAEKVLLKTNKVSASRTKIVPKSGQQILGIDMFDIPYIKFEKPQRVKFKAQNNKISNNEYFAYGEVASKSSTPVRRTIMVRKSGLKPFILPIEAVKNYYIRSNYGDVVAACFFQLLVSNTPIDEPYSGLRKRKYYTTKQVSSYDKEVYDGETYYYNKTAEEIYKEKEANREVKYYYEHFTHTPDDEVVRNDWVFVYKGKAFHPTDSEFAGCFDKPGDFNSVKQIATVFKTYSSTSKIKSVSFSYHNTNPRWEQLEYGGYPQENNSGPWKGSGKYGYMHGIKDHFTYQAPYGYLRLIEAQWNMLINSSFDIKNVKLFLSAEGFDVKNVGIELIKTLKINPREYDVKNFRIIEVKQ